MTDHCALAGYARYSLDNAVPSVSTRCALYGNSRDILHHLEEAERIYGKHTIKIDTSVFAAKNMGLPEMKDFKKRQSVLVRPKDASPGLGGEEEETFDEQEEAAKKRKPQINAKETPKQRFGDANQIASGIINLKMEFLNAVEARK